MITIGIIGVGRWGPNILRNFAVMDGVRIAAVCDADKKRLEAITKRYPEIQTTTDATALIGNGTIDAIVIVTPLATHYQLAKQALEAGKHVFVEKPLASSAPECEELIAIAAKKSRILFVGHTFKYNAGIRAAKAYIDSNELGKIYLIDANRTNLGPVRQDANALWDLASHDISIFSYWIGESPKSVSAHGGCYLNKRVEDVVYATFTYRDGIMAHVHASWLNPRKVREITVVGEKKMLVWNDMNLSEPIRIYNVGFDKDDTYQDSFADFRLSIREGEVIIPRIQLNEPLMAECSHFIECVQKGVSPLTDGNDGLQVVKALEAATRSIKEQSRTISIA